MELSEISTLKEKIDPKIQVGDYITLAKILGVPQNTARMRYHRENEEAVVAMQGIVENRENFIENQKVS